jgi:E3 ubiquitin-protein ligase HECTD4
VESVLARMHCRSALLELIAHCNSPSNPSHEAAHSLAASAALLQDLDVENLQLLSNELLAPPLPQGDLSTCCLLSAPSPAFCLAGNSCSLSGLLYHDQDQLRKELRVAIARAANQGEDYLIELSNQICLCLQEILQRETSLAQSAEESKQSRRC